MVSDTMEQRTVANVAILEDFGRITALSRVYLSISMATKQRNMTRC